MSNSRQHQFDINMKVKSIDQWKRLNCIISKETYDKIKETTSEWFNDKTPISVWVDKDQKEHYFIKIKLGEWDAQMCNFKNMSYIIGKNCSCTFFAKEYKFTPMTGTNPLEQKGWSATLKSNTIKRV